MIKKETGAEGVTLENDAGEKKMPVEKDEATYARQTLRRIVTFFVLKSFQGETVSRKNRR